MELKYPVNGTIKVPFYQSTWCHFKDGELIGHWGGKPDVNMISEVSKRPSEISSNERLRYLSCLTTAGTSEWQFNHKLKESLDFVLDTKAGKFYYRVFKEGELFSGHGGGYGLHRENGPAVIRVDGSTEWWEKDGWVKSISKDGELTLPREHKIPEVQEQENSPLPEKELARNSEPNLGFIAASAIAALTGVSWLAAMKKKQTKSRMSKSLVKKEERVYEYEKA